MSFYTHSDKTVEYSKIREIVKAQDLPKADERYLLGFLKALEPEGIKVSEIERAIEALKDDRDDEIDFNTAEKLKEAFESLLQTLEE